MDWDEDNPRTRPAEEEEPAQRAASSAWRVFILSGLLLFTLGQLLQTLVPVWGVVATELVCVLLPAAFVAWRRGYLRLALRLEAPRPSLLVLGLLIGLVGFAGASALDTLLRAAARALSGATPSPLAVPPTPDLASWVVLFAGGTLLAGFAEEALFRGYLLSHFALRHRPLAAAAIVGALFALVHPDPVGLPTRALLGLLYGVLTLRAGSLWPAVLAHAVNNAAGLLALRHSKSTVVARLEQVSIDRGQLLLLLGVVLLSAALLAVLLWALRRLTPDFAERHERFRETLLGAVDAVRSDGPGGDRGLLVTTTALLVFATALALFGRMLSPSRRIGHPSLYLRVTHLLVGRAPVPDEERHRLRASLEKLRQRVSSGQADPSYTVWTVEEDVAWMASTRRKVTPRDLERARLRMDALDAGRPRRAEVTLPIDSGWTTLPLALGPGERAVLAAYGRWKPAGAKQPVGPNGTPLERPRLLAGCPYGALLARRLPEGPPRCVMGATTLEGRGPSSRFAVRSNLPEPPARGETSTGSLTLWLR